MPGGSIPKPNNIYLTGFMGAGKSTIGPMLASRLNWHYADTDARIEAETGKTVARIFSEEGEIAFRALESGVIQSLSLGYEHVVSLGGGALTRVENLELIEKSGLLIYLSAPVESLVGRLWKTRSKRPLLRDTTSPAQLRSRVEELMAEREPFYRKAVLEIRTDQRKYSEVVEEILGGLEP